MFPVSRKMRDKIDYAAFVLPVLLFVSVMYYIPFLMSMFYSFTQWNGISQTPTFIGLENFKQIFTEDETFRESAVFTIKYGVMFVVLANVLGLLTAVLLDLPLKTRNFMRAMFFVPYIISLVIGGFIWKFIFVQGFTAFYEATGWEIFYLSWLGDPKIAIFSVLLVSLWHSMGFYTIIYIAGLQAIPGDILEAAVTDGASGFQKFFKVTLPLLGPSVTICTFLALTGAIKVFDEILSLTAGGPGGTTTSITLDIYKESFMNNRYGYGTAKALILFIVVLAITVLQVRFFKSREVDV